MLLLVFNFLLLALAISGKFKSPQLIGFRGIWFFTSLLCIELPWIFVIIQIFGSILILLLTRSSSYLESIATLIAIASLLLWFDLYRLTLAAQPKLRSVIGALTEDVELKTTELDRSPTNSTPYDQRVWKLLATRAWLRPFHYSRPGVERLADIAYGHHPRQTLDLYRPLGFQSVPQARSIPVLLHVHGGGWVVGHKHQQGQPLLWHMAQRGWLCVDINYRLAPKHRFPDCLVDVKTAISWLKHCAAEYGGNPDFIAITGGSAGGHLCALAALTANEQSLQPGFETLDTRVQAAVPMYGVYDITNSRETKAGANIVKLMGRFVMPDPLQRNPEMWRHASPIFRVHKDAPPMLIVHGTHDDLVPVEDARDFAHRMASTSGSKVLYAELPGAQHAFDMFHGMRTECSIIAIEQFLDWCHLKAVSSCQRSQIS